MIGIIGNLLPKTRVSNPVSKLLRPAFEAKGTKTVFGGLLASGSLVASALLYIPQPEQVQALGGVSGVELTTEKIKATSVVPNMSGISQGYHALHAGIDLTAPAGSAIYPVASGTIEDVIISKYGYGRHVRVRHANGISSLYAHLGKISVDEGQVVSRETKLGEIGLTGRTTGYHLHLEVYRNGLNVNPLPYIQE